MKNNEKLKKHHFWILAGIAPLLTVLAVILIYSEVGGAIEKEAKDTDDKLKAASGTQPKGTKAIEDFKVQKVKLEEQKLKLWDVNYKQQKNQFTWPGRDEYLKQLEVKYPKFGEKMQTSRDEFNKFKDRAVYEAAYDEAAESIRPTTFPSGNWRTGASGGPIFRYVSDWGAKYPTDRQVWLALEDLWVQRALLQPVIAINEGATKFTPLPDPAGAKPNPLKRSFANRIWRLDLEVPETGPHARKVIESKLTNLTDRLQVLGSGGTMRLKVKLSDTDQPIDYTIQENFIRPNASIVYKQEFPPADDARTAAKKKGDLIEVVLSPLPTSQGIPTNTEVKKIIEVAQVLDPRTVPVRQVLNVELGYKDCRHAAAPLKAHKDFPGAAEAVAAGADPAGGRGALAAPGATGTGDGGIAAPGAAGGRRGGKFGPPTAVLDGNRERYLETTDQVRRMPVAVVLLVDQLFMQDALIAYANSSLRFQVTQAHWKRFRGTLHSTGGGSSGFGGPPLAGGADTGTPDSGEGVISLPAGPTGTGGPLTLNPRGAPTSPGGGGGDPVPPGPGTAPPVAPPAAMYPGFGGFGGGSSGYSAPVPEAQLTSGLVELTIYGIVSLYEKYAEKPADGTTPTEPTPAPPTTPKDGTPMTPTPPAATTPKDGTPAPKDTAPMTPKDAAPMTPPPATPPTTPKM